ncbi:hypothetical protein KNP414_05543 [Paenibacillus mucilaginosus KNP414]|uniref:Uncharacterized protein n=1 Tax=Paenibacillus mucilaginosus (strain KNP414) TaxID=1036673 RepID=F8FK26_PAEMK|nr:hypothetical protein KNP414_05543 [Paenibacillus mucilaginosus KNP414]
MPDTMLQSIHFDSAHQSKNLLSVVPDRRRRWLPASGRTSPPRAQASARSKETAAWAYRESLKKAALILSGQDSFINERKIVYRRSSS